MKAVMYGAGNIGRGFIGQRFYLSGYETTFIDVNADAVNAMPANPASVLGEHKHEESCSCGGDHFHVVHPDTNWPAALAHGEKLGLGSREYELVKI